MTIVPKSTSQGNPFKRSLGPFPFFGNIGAPYMSLPRFTIGLLVWFFSTTMVLNVQNDFQPSSPPLEQYQP